MGHFAGLVTVVMPVFDGLPWLEQTLASVDAQRDMRMERIAVDDGSTDGSADLLRRRGWTVLSTDRVGPNVARAHGLANAEGSMVAFLDQDDIWHPEHLALAADTLGAMPSAGAAIAPRIPFFGRHLPRLGGHRHGPATFDPWAVYPVSLVDTPSMAVVHRTALEAAGGWPADRILGSDPLLWWRLSAPAPLAILPRRTVGVRRSARSLSSVSRDRPLDYLDHLRRAAADALFHAPVGEREWLAESGERILAAVSRLLTAIIDGNGMARAAVDMETALSASSDVMVFASIGFCGWLMAPPLRLLQATGVDPVALVVDGWPATARRTRAAALQMVAAVAGPLRTSGLALRSPFSPRRLSVAAAAWAFAAAERGGRVADPLNLRYGLRPWMKNEEPSR
ncbi:MAG: glycosyltransferase family 2 protein [Steroidobacteraceae bacterium]